MIMRCDYQPSLSAEARRADYLNFVPKNHQLELDILLEAIYKADPEKAKFVHLPFWLTNIDGEPTNWYLEWRHHTLLWRVREFLGLCDDIIAIRFKDGQAIVMSRSESKFKVNERSHDLRDPNSLQELGAHIIELLT